MIARDDPPGTLRAIRLSARAEADLAAAVTWYDAGTPGLGDDLLRAVDAVLQQAARFPESFPLIGPTVRRALVRRFPYGVFYAVLESELLVLAVVHARQRPRAWPSKSAG